MTNEQLQQHLQEAQGRLDLARANYDKAKADLNAMEGIVNFCQYLIAQDNAASEVPAAAEHPAGQ